MRFGRPSAAKRGLTGIVSQGDERLSCACKRAGRRRQDGFEFVALGPANLPFWLKVLLTYAKLKVLRTYAKLAAILKGKGC